MNKGGRPRAQIDKVQFENLCRLQCTEKEILSWFDITDKTLTRWCKETYGKGFSDVFREKREGGLISLRRAQWRLAEKNASMAIFLGTNYLGQKNTYKQDVTADVKATMTAEDMKVVQNVSERLKKGGEDGGAAEDS